MCLQNKRPTLLINVYVIRFFKYFAQEVEKYYVFSFTYFNEIRQCFR